MELPFMFRVRGTVILKIWWQILILAIYTTGVVCMHNYIPGWEIRFPQVLIPVLGIATGLLLVFRTNTASDRYHEGRKLWSTVTCNIRTLTRCFWVVVEEKEKSSREIVEKVSAINLLVAFAYATKNYLREEYSYDHKDLRDIIGHLPKFTSFSPSDYYPCSEEGGGGDSSSFSWKLKKSLVGDLEYLQHPARRKGSSWSRFGSGKGGRTYNVKAYDKSTPTNIPIELTCYIASYINSVRQRALVDPSTVNIMNNALNSLVDCLGGFERILRTPIPLAYSVHLHHALWLYLLSLPFQLCGLLNWVTIPAVGVASFSLLGILSIGWEIENPFGYEANDLPLEDFCDVIRKEAARIIAHPMPPLESWILSDDNRPLAPESQLTAGDLVKMEEADVRRILASVGAVRNSRRKLKCKIDEIIVKSDDVVEEISKEKINGVQTIFTDNP